MIDSINSVDIIQMSIVLYALRKAQQVESEAGLSLITKTLEKVQKNSQDIEKEIENNLNPEKEIYPWLGKNIDTLV